MTDYQQLRDALDYALQIIDSYEFDIRHGKRMTGVDLVAAGFCQGAIYREARARIKAMAGLTTIAEGENIDWDGEPV